MVSSRTFWMLVLLAAAIAGWRVARGQVDLDLIGQEREFAFDMRVDVRGSAGPFELSLYIPRSGEGVQVGESQIGAGKLSLRTEDEPRGRRLIAQGERSQLPSRIEIQTQIVLTPIRYRLPEQLSWSDLSTAADLDSTESVPTGHLAIRQQLAQLFPELPSRAVPSWREALQNFDIQPVEAVDRIHRFCLEDIRPATFSGNTDAITALRLGEASCGGKTRVMVAMLRTLGIQSRLIGGLILGDSNRKRTSHVWVEALLGDQWIPYDPLNGYRAERPAHYLPLYEGDEPLLLHSRSLAFDYGFRAPLERVPRAWSLERGTDAPLLRRDQFSLIVLAPFALLLVVFFRQVIGIDSIGVFLPVLLGFCVTQIGWMLAGALVGISLLLGAVVRFALSGANTLYVTRAAMLITFIVMMFLLFMVSLERLGIEASRGVLVLPMAALAMTIERLTVVALDRGSKDALMLLLQTLLLSAMSALVLMQPLFKVMTVTFPEILLVVLAEILVIGQYRGLRLSERRRFRQLLRKAAP